MKPFCFIGAAFCGAGWGVVRKARILPQELGGKVRYCPKTCVSSKVLIFVVKSKIKYYCPVKVFLST